MEELEELKKLEVRIGFQSENTEIEVINRAMWNELGTVNMPSRPFMRNSIDWNIDEINRFMKEQKEVLMNGGNAREVLENIGLFQKDLIQNEILTGDFEPNAPYTVEKKGSDHPLIDTGEMLRSVNFMIQQKGGG